MNLKDNKMTKLNDEDLKKIKADISKKTALRDGKVGISIIVHMGTCGIAAGAREIMSTLMDEISKSDRSDIKLTASGCLEACSHEPSVTIKIPDTPPTVYQNLTQDKAVTIFQKHVLTGEVQPELAAPEQ